MNCLGFLGFGGTDSGFVKRHIQFLPVERMRDNDDGKAWKPLIDIINDDSHHGTSPVQSTINFEAKKQPIETIQKCADISTESKAIIGPLPFLHRSSPISNPKSSEELLTTYKSLYNDAQSVVHNFYPELGSPPEISPNPTNGSARARISYNLAMTTHCMMICPRRSEGAVIVKSTSGQSSVSVGDEQIGPIALNGTLLAGTLLVKTSDEWDALRGPGGPKALEGVLQDVGIPPNAR